MPTIYVEVILCVGLPKPMIYKQSKTLNTCFNDLHLAVSPNVHKAHNCWTMKENYIKFTV